MRNRGLVACCTQWMDGKSTAYCAISFVLYCFVNYFLPFNNTFIKVLILARRAGSTFLPWLHVTGHGWDGCRWDPISPSSQTQSFIPNGGERTGQDRKASESAGSCAQLRDGTGRPGHVGLVLGLNLGGKNSGGFISAGLASDRTDNSPRFVSLRHTWSDVNI